jgi:PIN domain nuclease of toxin-antitoxin system
MFVTDTHPIAYYAGRKYSKLSRRVLHMFEDAQAGKTVIAVPTAALLEITDLMAVGAVQLPTRFDHWCLDLEREDGFLIEPLMWQDVNEARYLPFRDPMDRLIAGTAIRLGFPLITKDQGIVDSGLVETVW